MKRRVTAPRVGGWGARYRPSTILFRLHQRGLLNALVVGGDPEWRVAAARDLHHAGSRGRPGFIVFDARRDPEPLLMSLRLWSQDPAAATEPVPEAGTVYVEHVTELSVAAQAALLSFAERVTDQRATPGSPARLIAGSPADPLQAVENGRFSVRLYDCLDKLRVETTARGRFIVA
jgi:DNA-binding NtrC family response regulator